MYSPQNHNALLTMTICRVPHHSMTMESQYTQHTMMMYSPQNHNAQRTMTICRVPHHSMTMESELTHPANVSEDDAFTTITTHSLHNHETLSTDPNTKRFKLRLIYFNTDTQYANFRGNPLYEATKRHLTDKRSKTI